MLMSDTKANKPKCWTKSLMTVSLPEWATLKSLGQNSLLKSSYFWFIFVPVAARLLGQIKSPLVLRLFEQDHIIPLELPFSWYHFFFAAVFFSIGNLLFALRCPELVQRYNTAQESTDADNGSFFMHRQLCCLPGYVFDDDLRHSLLYAFKAAEEANVKKPSAAQLWIAEHGTESTPSTFEICDLISSNICDLRTDTLGNLFGLVYRAHSRSRPFARLIATVSYACGFIFVCRVFGSNVYFVLSRYMGW